MAVAEYNFLNCFLLMLFFVNQLFINSIKVVNANCIKCLSNSIKDFGKQLAYFTIFRNMNTQA